MIILFDDEGIQVCWSDSLIIKLLSQYDDDEVVHSLRLHRHSFVFLY